MWDKLKHRWKVDSGLDVFIILVVFAFTGSSVVFLKKYIFGWIGVGEHTATWLRFCLSLFIILPMYQVILLAYGWIFGKFNFFWEFEKRTFSRMKRLWQRKE